ncbi:MAG: SpoIIE family protein phosphatase [Bacteroidota bacterium]|nr:SpoIIE family protein phosphatase [Bacteroidota bacterium]
MKRLLFITFLFTTSFAWCQVLPKNIQKLIAGLEVKSQLSILDSVAKIYKKDNPTLFIQINKAALHIAKANDKKNGTLHFYVTLNRFYRAEGVFDSALLYIDSAIKFAIAHKLEDAYGEMYDYQGLTYMRMGSYEKATEDFFTSIKYSEKIKDSAGIRDAFDHLGSVNFYRRDHKSAVKFYKKALSYCSSKNVTQYVSTLDNIGLGFSNLTMFDSALFYQKRAVTIIEQLNDSSFLAESYINIGSTLLNLKRFKEAELYFTKAYDINSKLNNEYAFQLSNLYMGKLFLKTGKFNKAMPYLEKSFAISEKLKIPSQIKEAALTLTNLYDTIGDYKKSAHYFEIVVNTMEETMTEENTRAINELAAKYETEKKQQQIQFLTQDKLLKENKIEKDRYIKLFIGIVAGLLLLLSIIFIYRFREKKKDNNLLQEKNEAIASQKNEIEEQKEELQHKNKEITDSINYAKRIQASVLPSVNLIKNLFPQSFIYFQPKDIVSGDFYWIAQNSNYIYYAVADCTGHGVPGAMMSMLGNSLLNQIVLNTKIISPDAILKELHFHVVKTLNENMQQRDSKDGMDIALIRIDLKNKLVVYAGAGRPLYVIKNNELVIYKADKYSIGGIYDTQEVSYALHEIKIDALTQLYMFTDGVPDQFGGPKGKKFMTKQLQEILKETSSLSVNEQEQQFKNAFESWKSQVEQTDDVTLVSVRLS